MTATPGPTAPRNDAIEARTVSLTAHGGDEIEAYLAGPVDGGRHGGVVVVHHLPGYDPPAKEIARTFADHGYIAVCPNLYSREAPGPDWRAAAAQVRAAGGVPDEQVVADIAAAAEAIRARDDSNGKVAVIGYCSGGRQAVLAACRTDLDAVIDCYGAYVMRTADADSGLPRRGFADEIANLACPLLGLFGEHDPAPPVEEVRELERALQQHGKDADVHVYEDAGHAFFSVDSPKYRPTAAAAGWQQIWSFLGRWVT